MVCLFMNRGKGDLQKKFMINNIHNIIQQMKFGEGRIYAEFTPTLR